MFDPTPEQADSVTKFGTGESLKINAYAGTGKTSTLTILGRSTRKLGTYVSFNAAIAKEAQTKFPDNVKCKTGHGLAFASMVKRFGAPKMTSNLNGGIVAAKMHFRGRTVEHAGKTVMQLSPRNWGYLCSETIKRWMRTDDDAIEARHVPLDGKLGKLEGKPLQEIIEEVVDSATKVWGRMTDPGNDMPLSHDGYLKVWAMGRPHIDADYILLDEAQDTNGVMLGLMSRQQSQLVCVGDRWQQIYAWRGAQNAMVKLPSRHESRLTTSFRFGEAIADYATGILALLGENVPLKGNPAKASSIGFIDKPDTILCRTNARLIETAFSLVGQGKRPHIIGGVDELLAWVKGAESLMQGRGVEYLVELFGFQHWDDVRMVAQVDQDPDLTRWVRLIDDYGCEALRTALERLPKTEKGSDVVLCSGHKSKGREWGKVKLESDFLAGIKTKDADLDKSVIMPTESMEPELCLLYVAATRAMVRLDVHPELQDRIDKLMRGHQRRKEEEALRARAAERAAA